MVSISPRMNADHMRIRKLENEKFQMFCRLDPPKSACIRGYLRALIRSLLGAALLALSFHTAGAQSSIRDYRRAHERQILAEFTQLVAIPNVASDAPNIRRNAE